MSLAIYYLIDKQNENGMQVAFGQYHLDMTGFVLICVMWCAFYVCLVCIKLKLWLCVCYLMWCGCWTSS